MLENAVYIELIRRKKTLYYWKGRNHYEVDFVILEGTKVSQLIQVCWEIDEKTVVREERALLKAMAEFGLNKGLIITRDKQGTTRKDEKEIVYRPFYMWVMEKI